jgi:hypothetical protein
MDFYSKFYEGTEWWIRTTAEDSEREWSNWNLSIRYFDWNEFAKAIYYSYPPFEGLIEMSDFQYDCLFLGLCWYFVLICFSDEHLRFSLL